MNNINQQIAKKRHNYNGSMSEFDRVETGMRVKSRIRAKSRIRVKSRIGFALAILVIIALGFSTKCAAQDFLDFTGYRIGWKQGAAWVAFGIAGTSHGALEAYHADARVFEKAWGVNEKSFWGSRAWERNYGNNDYTTGNHKGEWLGNVGRDFWHTARFTEKVTLISGSFTIGFGKRKTKFKVADLLIGAAVSTVSANITYKILR